jgi:hypothetical protein
MKRFSIFWGLLASYSLVVSAKAGERILSKSPDGKFALRETLTELNPVHGDTAIIEIDTGKVAVQLHGDAPVATERLIWSKDSRRVAGFRYDSQGGATRIFFRTGSTFEEIKLPGLPSPQLPELPKADASEAMLWVKPLRWLESGELLLESELQNKTGARAALQITVGFDQGNRPVIRKSEPEKMSIVDYFLLLPSKTLENPAYEWLYVMRANGNIIDKESGYMSCPGDGAQPEFELALFRYLDGRALVALCSGELEGTDAVQLQFYELGADGRMQSIGRPILPGTVVKYDPESGYSKEGWQFYLPRHGRTIVARSEKTKKILRKFTWDGEKFQEEK